MTLPDEIDHIWCRPWSRLSSLFLVNRYLALTTVRVMPSVDRQPLNFAGLQTISFLVADFVTWPSTHVSRFIPARDPSVHLRVP